MVRGQLAPPTTDNQTLRAPSPPPPASNPPPSTDLANFIGGEVASGSPTAFRDRIYLASVPRD